MPSIRFLLVEHRRFELLTPTLPVLCATSCANAPNSNYNTTPRAVCKGVNSNFLMIFSIFRAGGIAGQGAAGPGVRRLRTANLPSGRFDHSFFIIINNNLCRIIRKILKFFLPNHIDIPSNSIYTMVNGLMRSTGCVIRAPNACAGKEGSLHDKVPRRATLAAGHAAIPALRPARKLL